MASSDQADRITFAVSEANSALPFDDNSFDAVLCIDSMNHFPDRSKVFQEWRRVLRPGRRAVFTDPVVITGPVTNDELALRSSIGLFLFVPPGVNEQLIEASGFRLLKHKDVSANAALVSGRWHESRQRHKDASMKIQGEERFEGLQQFLRPCTALPMKDGYRDLCTWSKNRFAKTFSAAQILRIHISVSIAKKSACSESQR
jgi:SAM-dependent methyltransferase